MSKNNYNAVSHEVMYTISEINRLSPEEIKSLYGIEILEDGTVLDETYARKFDNVAEWATFNVEQDDIEYEEHFHDRGNEE